MRRNYSCKTYCSVDLCRCVQTDVENMNRHILIMRFVIPVEFYEITNVQCVYWSNTYLLTYLLRGAESFLRSLLVCS